MDWVYIFLITAILLIRQSLGVHSYKEASEYAKERESLFS